MGACGCGDNSPDKVYRIGKGRFLGVAAYLGCSYCGTGVGFDLTFMNAAGRKLWADRIKVETLEFAENPADGSSLMLGCVGLDELREAAAKMQADKRMERGFRGFRTVEDWLDEHGLELLQEAFRIHLMKLLASAEPSK